MFAKLTSENQLILPKAIIPHLSADYFEVFAEEDGRVILTPVKGNARSEAVRDKLEALGITEKDIAEAIAWARKAPQ